MTIELNKRETIINRATSLIGIETTNNYSQRFLAGPYIFGGQGFITYCVTNTNKVFKGSYGTDTYYKNVLPDSAIITDRTQIKPGDIIFDGAYYCGGLVITEVYQSSSYTEFDFITGSPINTNFVSTGHARWGTLSPQGTCYNTDLLDIAPYNGNSGLTNQTNYQEIANAIRSRGDFTDTYYPSEMAQAILDIPHDETPEPLPATDLLVKLNNQQMVNIDSSILPTIGSDALGSYTFKPYMFYSSSTTSGTYPNIALSQDMFSNTSKEIYLYPGVFGGGPYGDSSANYTVDLTDISNDMYLDGSEIFPRCTNVLKLGNVIGITNGYNNALDEAIGNVPGRGILYGAQSVLKTIEIHSNNKVQVMHKTGDNTPLTLFSENQTAPRLANFKIKVKTQALVNAYKADPLWENYWDYFEVM